MSLALVTVPPGTLVGEVREICARRRAGCAFIVDDEALLGIACPSDLGGADPSLPVDHVMSTPVHTIGAAASVREARALMEGLDVGFLPVLAGDVLVGLLTRSEIESDPRDVA